MSPPKISLASKETHKQVFDEILPEKKDGDDVFPSVIQVETERRARNLRQMHKRQKCRKILCGSLIVIGVSIAALTTMLLVMHFRHPHRKNWEVKNGGRPEVITVDPENQLIYTTLDHDQNSNTSPMEILHEYDRGLIAFKDTDNNKCYIDRLDESFEDGYERWRLYESTGHNETKTLKVISGPIEFEVLKHITDVHIYAHCEKAESVWAMEIDIQEVTTQIKTVQF